MATETLRPTTYSLSGNAAISAASNAYDTSTTTYATVSDGMPSDTGYCTFITFQPKTLSWSSATLNISITASSIVNDDSNDVIAFEYSTNGGSSWTAINTYTASGVNTLKNSVVDQSVSLSAGLDISQLKVRIKMITHTIGLIDQIRIKDVYVSATGTPLNTGFFEMF